VGGGGMVMDSDGEGIASVEGVGIRGG
jgi:hypothetical protein